MYDAFLISAPADKAFARRLSAALTATGHSVWVEGSDTPQTNEAWIDLYSALEASDNVLVLLSPEAVGSPVVREQIDYAARHHKRLIPLVYRDANTAPLNRAIHQQPWIFFRDGDDFATMIDRLASAMRAEEDFVRAHTDLLVRSRDWERNGRKPRYLLRGGDLRGAEAWQAQSAAHEWKPIERQTEFIHASRRAHDAGQRRPLPQFALLADDMAEPVEFAGHTLVEIDDFVERVGHFARHSGPIFRQPGGEIPFLKCHQRGEEDL